MPEASPSAPGFGDLMAGYRPLPGVPDEALDGQGRLRPVWQRLIAQAAALGPEELARRFARGDEYLRDAGVFFRQYGAQASPERDWPLSHFPVLIHDAEWQALAQGLAQRADLLEAVAADLYGPQRLIAEGHLPAGLIAQSPEFLRPLVGVTPRGGHYLNLLAFEIGRGPDGRWWVLSDRTQAPSGAGFALENRVAAARIFPEAFAASNVHRLAGFFRAFRATLDALAGARGRAAILTPGPMNDSYYEHAYIARYLGLMLLEGEDLGVDRGRAMVRTVSGPEPVGVLWRRLDGTWLDPLELDDASYLGAPGLVEAVRQGHLALVNALGTGVLEIRALMAFLPRISEVLHGRALAVPNLATWWCGEAAARDHVLAQVAAQPGRLAIGPALSTRPSFEPGGEGPGWFRAAPEAALAERLTLDGALLAGQEAATLSTTPAYADERLQPRPTTLRVFLARGPQGWQVMPGGYARIGGGADASALAMQRGGAVADVWVLSDRPVTAETLLPARSAPYQRPEPGVLPSRAADNLFWLGRYVERAEGILRLLRAFHLRLADAPNREAPLLAHLSAYLEPLGVDTAQRVPEGLHATLASAVYSAGKVRDRFSIDGWMALNDLARTARRMTRTVVPGEDEARAMGVLLRKITGFSGLVHENMYRFTGWRFLTIGRSLERAGAMAALLADLAGPDAPPGALDLAVEVGDSTMSHRRRYAVETTRETVIDLLALDALNPRSVLYHLAELRAQVALLPGVDAQTGRSALWRAVVQAHARLAVCMPEDLDRATLDACRADIAGLSDLISEAYFR